MTDTFEHLDTEDNSLELVSQRGAVTIEAALTLPLFFFMIFMFVALVFYLSAELSMDFAVYRGINRGLYGQQAVPMTIEDAIASEIVSQGNIWGLSLDPGDIKICPVGQYNCALNSVGNQGDFFSVVVTGVSFLGTQHSTAAFGAYVQ